MGLFDTVVGMINQGGAGQDQAALMNVITGLLNQDGPQGGLAGLVQQFQQGGLGDVVASWISTGQNLPISAEQLQSVLGSHSALAGVAEQAGLSQGDLMGQLSQLLPQVIDQMTPQGQLPAAGGQADLLGVLGGLLKG